VSHPLRRLRTAAGIAIAQLRDTPLRTVFAIIGIALAVLAVTVLAGTGLGVIDTGERQFETAGQDIWVSAGETRLTPARGGGFENVLRDSRTRTAEIEAHDGVESAYPIAFDTVYVDTGDGDFETIIATGIPGTGNTVQVRDGPGFTNPDSHYAGGSYDGPMTHEVIIDQRTGERFDVGRNDTVRIGSSLTIARSNEFTVVGTSGTISELLGASTVTLPLDEFHRVTGTTRTEPATFIMITVEDDRGADAVADELRSAHPDLTIRTNSEQLRAVLQEQVLVLAAGGIFVGLALVAGVALTAQLLTLLAYQQRKTFAALLAQGCSRTTIAAIVGWQGVVLGFAGGLLGIGLTPLVNRGLNEVASAVVGFDGLVTTELWILAVGGVIAVGIGTTSAVIAGFRVVRNRPLEQLQ